MFWFERRLNPGFYDHCQAFFEHIDFKPNAIPEPSDHHIMLGLIAQGQGVALIPASLRKVKYQGVVFRDMKEEHEKLRTGIAVAYSQHNQSPVLHTFLELVRKTR
jgi:DNA-binding transcriptional LysR family regulator